MSTPAQTPIEITLGDGTVVKGANLEEAFKVVAKMKEDTAAALREAREQVQGMRGELDTLKASEQNRQAELERQRQISHGNGFDKQKYYQLLNDDPVAANDYMFQHRFQRSPDDVIQTFERYDRTISAIEQQTVSAAFVQQHAEEWPGSPEAAKVMRERVESLVHNSGFGFNLDTLNYAWSQLVSEGKITPAEKEEEKREEPNPSLSGAGQGAADAEIAKVEAMSDKELEALVRSRGMLR